MSAKDISIKHEISVSTVYNKLREQKIKKRKPNYSYDRNYFEKIDSPSKAYFLGFILGDGHIRGHPKIKDRPQTLAFRIGEKDKEVLYKLIDEIDGDKNQIKKDNRIIQGKMNLARILEISSTKISQDLISKGIMFKNKSKTQKWINIRNELEDDFVRGIIDSDGWVSLHKDEKGYYSLVIGVCGTESVCNGFSKWIFKKLGIETRVYKHGSIYETRFKTSKVSTLYDLYTILYKEDSIFLSRKKENFEKFFDGIFEKHVPFISTNDYSKLSVFVPILGCSYKCAYCFNNQTRFPGQMNSIYLTKKCLELSKDVETFVFGGNDAIGINYKITLSLSRKLKSKGCKIIIQTRNLYYDRFRKICELKPDILQLTLNNTNGKDALTYTKKAIKEFNVETRIVYIPERTEYPKEIPINLVQQFIPGECLDPEYNKIPKPARGEVMAFAKKIGADEIITQENGREKV